MSRAMANIQSTTQPAATIPVPTAGRAGGRWTKDDDEYLKDCRRRGITHKVIAEQLGRTELACRLHLNKLGDPSRQTRPEMPRNRWHRRRAAPSTTHIAASQPFAYLVPKYDERDRQAARALYNLSARPLVSTRNVQTAPTQQLAVPPFESLQLPVYGQADSSMQSKAGTKIHSSEDIDAEQGAMSISRVLN